MIQVLHTFVIRTAVQTPAISVINGLRPADAATEINNDFEWILDNS